jgi:hypothetical protein
MINFCSSPWFHIRLSHSGHYKLCRWNDTASQHHIENTSILDFYNSQDMQKFRKQFLSGDKGTGCDNCYYQESFGKTSGRQKQLLKSVVAVDDLAKSIKCSPHYDNFKYSHENDGFSNYYPTDLQIDLGNMCNSACIMCRPIESSRLHADYKKLHVIEPSLFSNPKSYSRWTQDPNLIDKFVNELQSIPNIRYIHLLGGETLYDPAFYTICDRLIETGKAKDIIIGTTTNATIYNEKIKLYMESFKQFHLGISIETVTTLNDYIRWPSKIEQVIENISKFNSLRQGNDKVIITLRITPNIFTAYHLDSLFRYMLDNNLPAESCNILFRPEHLQMQLLPDDIRQEIIEKIEKIISDYGLSKTGVLNIRNAAFSKENIADTILEYYQFFKNYDQPIDIETHRYNLVKFLKAFETIRKNRITEYEPRYTNFLRHYGYENT